MWCLALKLSQTQLFCIPGKNEEDGWCLPGNMPLSVARNTVATAAWPTSPSFGQRCSSWWYLQTWKNIKCCIWSWYTFSTRNRYQLWYNTWNVLAHISSPQGMATCQTTRVMEHHCLRHSVDMGRLLTCTAQYQTGLPNFCWCSSQSTAFWSFPSLTASRRQWQLCESCCWTLKSSSPKSLGQR